MINLDPKYCDSDKMMSKLKEKISCLDGVTEVYKMRSVYDLVVRIKGDSKEKLKNLLESKIKRISGVGSTKMIYTAYNP